MKKLILFLGVMAGMLFSQSCKKNSFEPGAYEGVAICASSTFKFKDSLRVNGSRGPVSADLQIAPHYVTITASLNERVSWTVTIKGTISNATKTFTGLSDTIGVKWYGTPDGGEEGGDKFFLTAGEPVTITVTPACTESHSVNLTLTRGSKYNFFGSVLCDFDGVGSVYAYNSVDPNIGPWVKNKDTTWVPASPQGGRSHIMYAPENHSGWYIGGMGQAVDLSAVLGTNLRSDSVYINLYVNGTKGTTLTIDMVEKVGNTNYHFKQNIIPTWTGWKMVSYKLSDLYIGNPLKVTS